VSSPAFFCEQCGASPGSNQRFCEKCGQPVPPRPAVAINPASSNWKRHLPRGWLLAALAVAVLLADLFVYRFTVHQELQRREEARLELWQMNLPYRQEVFFQQIKAGNIYAVQVFLEAGMSPSEKNPAGKTPLMIAEEYRQAEIAAILMDKTVAGHFAGPRQSP